MRTIGFGGGCHWCTEAVFACLRGVGRVEQGFIRSKPPHDAWSEAVRLEFSQDVIPLDVLVDVHLRTHASTSDHKMRGKYRSAIYVETQRQVAEVRAVLDGLQKGFDRLFVTQILPLEAFKASDPRFHRYFERHADGPFCTRYIDPKLAFLRTKYAEHCALDNPPRA